MDSNFSSKHMNSSYTANLPSDSISFKNMAKYLSASTLCSSLGTTQ